MKKNRMMRLASVLLVLTMLSTSVISGTFAKYTTQDSAEDSARVAKWGVEVQVVGNLYGETYGNKDNENKIVSDESTDGFSVQTYNKVQTDDVVAPGTLNEDGLRFSLNGTPEVSGKVTATMIYENVYLKKATYGVMVKVPDGVITEANFDEFGDLYALTGSDKYQLYDPTAGYADRDFYQLKDEVTLTGDYYPVEYAMISGDNTNTGYNAKYRKELGTDTLEELVNAIGGQFGDLTETSVDDANNRTTVTYSGATFNPNDDLQKVFALGNQEINWKWDFCQKETPCDEFSGDDSCEHCKADTILGWLHSNDDANPYNVVIKAADGSYKQPEKDHAYNLEPYFSLDITVEQTD